MDRFPARRLDNSARRVRKSARRANISDSGGTSLFNCLPGVLLTGSARFFSDGLRVFDREARRRRKPNHERSTDKRVFYENFSPDHDQPYSANRLSNAAKFPQPTCHAPWRECVDTEPPQWRKLLPNEQESVFRSLIFKALW
jgi:hypothetical protein